MKKITNLYVAEVLRNKKLFNHHLNFKKLKDWSKGDFLEFDEIVNGERPKRVFDRITSPKKHYPYKPVDPSIKKVPNQKNVIRFEDGKIYRTLKECAIENGLSQWTLSRALCGKSTYENMHIRFSFI